MIFPEFRLHLPPWIPAALPPAETVFASVQERMRLVVELARRNVAEGTGGPFAAAVFDLENGHLVAPGVNLVIASHCSVAHAETVAIIMAQQRLGDFDLGRGGRRLELVASTEPCAMCYGAVPWSGVCSLACGARGEDACRVGFDEGEKPEDWITTLERRGIAVFTDVLRGEAAAVLERYAAGGGLLYNGRREPGSETGDKVVITSPTPPKDSFRREPER